MLREVRLAIRRFWFKPAHTAVMVVIIGVGIGAATALFSVVDQTILRPPPFAYADRLVQVMDLWRDSGARSTVLTHEKIAGWQQQRALFEAFEGYTSRDADLTGHDMEPERVRGLVVTNGLFRMLGVQPSLGRGFSDTDGRPGAERVVVISDGLWKRKFGGTGDVLGARVAISDEPHTVIGIMPRRFRLVGDEDLWLPTDVTTGHGGHFLGLARLAPGVDLSGAQTLAGTLAARLQAQTPLPSPFWDIYLEKKKVAYVPDTTKTALFVLLGAVGFVLLITCANTASLLLTQIGVRQRESAIRAAIGAPRTRLFREVLIESILLACAGGGIGILLAIWGVDAIVAAAPPNLTYSATSPIEVDLRILAAAAAVTLLTGVIFGVVPAVRGSTPNVESILKSGAGGGPGRTTQGVVSGALVVAEVAFSLVLLVGAALMARTFINLHALEPGFDASGVVAVTISLPTDRYVGPGARAAFFESLRERLVGMPGVSDVASAASVFGGGGGIHFGVPEVEGGRVGEAGERVAIPSNDVTPEYFRALRIPIVAGRTFTDEDEPDAVVISKSMADRFWPQGNAVGRRFKVFRNADWRTVIGIAGDVQGRASGHATALQIYRRYASPSPNLGTPPATRGYSGRVVIVRAGESAAIVPAIRAAVHAMDPNQPVDRIDLVADLYADGFARERFVLQLMAVFGGIAVALTAAGIFGVLAQTVARRTREIGVRVALGARAADVAQLVASRGVILVTAGTLVGLAGALTLTRFLEALLFQVRPADPVSFAVVTTTMLIVAVVACWLPTRRALGVDPAVALRVD